MTIVALASKNRISPLRPETEIDPSIIEAECLADLFERPHPVRAEDARHVVEEGGLFGLMLERFPTFPQ